MFTFSQSPATASLNSPGLIHSRTLPYRSHRDGGWPDHFRLKYTQVLSQQIVFTQSPSLSNNPKILNNYLIFAVVKRTMNKRDTFYVLLYREDIPFKLYLISSLQETLVNHNSTDHGCNLRTIIC